MPAKGQMPKNPFPKGNKLAKGGARPGSGMKPNWYKKRCAELLQRRKLFDFLADVGSGEEVAHVVTLDGKVVKIPPKVADRIKAICEMRDTAWGRPGGNVDLTTGGQPFSSPTADPVVPTLTPKQMKKLASMMKEKEGASEQGGDAPLAGAGA